MLGNSGIRYRIGTWDADMQDSSSNFREFENVVEALKKEAHEGHLRNALIFLCTDNSMVEAALVEGNSTSPKLFKLVLAVHLLEMQEGAKIIMSHVLGEQMKAQGTNGVSRGQLKEGVSVGKDMLAFIPFHLLAVQRLATVEPWICSWLGHEAELLNRKAGSNVGMISWEGNWTKNDSGDMNSKKEDSFGPLHQPQLMLCSKSSKKCASNIRTLFMISSSLV
jgi:hypothetical protein